MKIKKTTIGIAIATYNRDQVLVDTLKSCFELRPRPKEILVVDQTVEHEKTTGDFLSKMNRLGQLRFIHQKTPNLPKARNRALRETKCEVIIFIDDDVILPKDFVAKHAKNYMDPSVAAVAGRVKQDAKNPVSKPGPPGGWPRVVDPLYFPMDSHQRVEGIAAFRGCNHSIRVSSVHALGGYDENYVGNAIGEENDLALRIWKSGGRIVFDPAAWLYHLLTPSGGCRVFGPRKRIPEWRVHFSMNYFFFRHYFPSLIFAYVTLFSNFGGYVFRKKNREKPWQLPWAALSYLYAWFRAGFLAYQRGKLQPSNFSSEDRRELSEFGRKRVVQGLWSWLK